MEKRIGTIQWQVRQASPGEAENRTIYGYAIVYNKTADLGWFTEEVMPGFATDALAEPSLDVRALFNHDRNQILARKRNSEMDTLVLREDANGLFYEFEAPQTTAGNDLLESIRRGDVSQSSFAFDVKDDAWVMKNGKDHRILQKAKKLWDVSPVTFPAYHEATVGMRSKAEAIEKGFYPAQKKTDTPPAQSLVHLINVKKRSNTL